MRRTCSVLALVIAMIAGCATAPTPSPTVSPQAQASPTASTAPRPSATGTAAATVFPDTEEPSFGPPATIPPDAVRPEFPAPLLVSGRSSVAAVSGTGCAAVYYDLPDTVINDDPACATGSRAIEDPIPMMPGALIMIAAPEGWLLGSDLVSDTDVAVQVLAIPTEPKDGVVLVGPPSGSLSGVLMSETGIWDIATVEAVAPREPGDYVLQLKAQISRDPWRRGGLPWFWWIVVR